MSWKEIDCNDRRAAIEELENLALQKISVPINACEGSWAAEHLVHQAWNNMSGHEKRKAHKNSEIFSLPLERIEIISDS